MESDCSYLCDARKGKVRWLGVRTLLLIKNGNLQDNDNKVEFEVIQDAIDMYECNDDVQCVIIYGS